MHFWKTLWILLLAGALVGCSAMGEMLRTDETNPSTAQPAAGQPAQEPGWMRGMGHDAGMHARHMASVPEAYAGKTNPATADAFSWERGAQIYTVQCQSCHGPSGLGDGPAAAALNPQPAPLARTTRMMGDDFLFWRIREGGAMEPFNSAMPAWKDTLSEEQTWDVINYLRALTSGKVTPQAGTAFDPAQEAAFQAETLAKAVEQGVITQAEADAFLSVHTALEAYRAQSAPGSFTGPMETVQAQILVKLIADGTLTQVQADTFNAVHEKLHAANLMP